MIQDFTGLTWCCLYLIQKGKHLGAPYERLRHYVLGQHGKSTMFDFHASLCARPIASPSWGYAGVDVLRQYGVSGCSRLKHGPCVALQSSCDKHRMNLGVCFHVVHHCNPWTSLVEGDDQERPVAIISLIFPMWLGVLTQLPLLLLLA